MLVLGIRFVYLNVSFVGFLILVVYKLNDKVNCMGYF